MTLLSLGVWLGVVALAWCFYVAVQILADRLYPDPTEESWLEPDDPRMADYRTVIERIRDGR